MAARTGAPPLPPSFLSPYLSRTCISSILVISSAWWAAGTSPGVGFMLRGDGGGGGGAGGGGGGGGRTAREREENNADAF